MTKRKKELVNALKYNSEKDNAPKIVAQGTGYTAEKIKEIAMKHNVPIYKDESLSQQLYNLSIGDEIPNELYQIVAEVLSFVADIDKKNERNL